MPTSRPAGLRDRQERGGLELGLRRRLDVRSPVPLVVFAPARRTTSALRERARQRANLVIDNAFATTPGFNI